MLRNVAFKTYFISQWTDCIHLWIKNKIYENYSKSHWLDFLDLKKKCIAVLPVHRH